LNVAKAFGLADRDMVPLRALAAKTLHWRDSMDLFDQWRRLSSADERRGTISYGSRHGASAMTTPHILEILANRVKDASSLQQLYEALTAFEDEVELHHEGLDVEDALAEYIDLDRLPTFGSEPPKNMVGVRSWDKDHLLVGTGPFWILDFVERGEASEKNTIEGRAALARKAHSGRLKDVYRSLRAPSRRRPIDRAFPSEKYRCAS
jgi:hypothetical protein